MNRLGSEFSVIARDWNDGMKTSGANVGGTGVSPVPSKHSKWKIPVGSFQNRRRNLPHIESPGSTCFVTFRVKRKLVLTPDARHIVFEACKHWDGKKYDLFGCTVMPDHVHLILKPLPIAKASAADEVGKLIGIDGGVWLDESWDRVVRDETEFLEKLNYITWNAVKRELAEAPDDYPWMCVSAGGL